PVTASLMGLDGQGTQTIPVFRLPGLSSGAILLQTNLTAIRQGHVNVQVRSLSAGGMSPSSAATVSAAPATSITLTGVNFSAVAGSSFSGQVATLSDNDPAPVFAITINWGDGTSTAGTAAPVAGTPGSYAV